MESPFNPFTYQPGIARAYGMEAEFPPDVRAQARANPARAQHIQAQYQFSQWLKRSEPRIFDAARNRTNLLELQGVEKMAASAAPGKLAGLGQAADMGEQGPITQWGTQLLDLAKGYMVYDAQKDLMKVNLSRAEQGLPPIDPGYIAPQVQLGVAPNVQTLAYVALAGMVVIGLLATLGGKRK